MLKIAVTDETSAPREPPPSREALEKTIRTLRKHLERSERYRRRAEDLREHNDQFLRNVTAELRVAQDALEDPATCWRSSTTSSTWPRSRPAACRWSTRRSTASRCCESSR